MANLSNLQFGSSGPLTEFLQLALQRSGFGPGSIDGTFGRQTQRAVQRFQSARGLIPDGIAGPQTWRALRPYMTGFVSYAIRPGDTLYRIANAYGTTIRAIETANPELNPLNLTTGTTIYIPLAFPVVPTNIRFTSTVLEFCVIGLRTRYPFLAVDSIGSSVMGKPLYRLRIGRGENSVFYNGAHHANEWITAPLLLQFLEEYAEAYSRRTSIFDQDAATLYRLSSLSVVPMVNPDGVDLVTGALTDGRYYAQALAYSRNYPAIPFPSGWKANINGVDPNLQYPAGWEAARTIKFAQGFTSPAPRDYVGAAPLEAPESRSVYDFTRRENFRLTLSYHTQGKVIFWKYLDYLPENSLEIAQEFAAVSGYDLELTPESSGYAGYKDWFISAYDRPGYTIEAGIGISPLPLSQFDEIYTDNLGILVRGLTATI